MTNPGNPALHWGLFEANGHRVRRFVGFDTPDQAWTEAVRTLRANCDEGNTTVYLQQITTEPPYTPSGDKVGCTDLPPVDPEEPPGNGG